MTTNLPPEVLAALIRSATEMTMAQVALLRDNARKLSETGFKKAEGAALLAEYSKESFYLDNFTTFYDGLLAKFTLTTPPG